MLGKHRRVNLAVCRFPVPVVTQQIFLVKNIVIVRGQRNRANRENRLCKTVRVTLIICQRHIRQRCVWSEGTLCNVRLDACCCSFRHFSLPPALILLVFGNLHPAVFIFCCCRKCDTHYIVTGLRFNGQTA